MRKYNSIVRYGKPGTPQTLEGNAYIVIQEKIDGANASFKREGDKVLAFSRNTELDAENNLRGFYQWVQETIKPETLPENRIFYGEWSAKHKLDYGENHNKFYLFDVYNETRERYISFPLVGDYAINLGLNLVPVFYHGFFNSLEHIQSFIGKSMLGEVGEGVVVKNYDYESKHGDQLFSKFVSDAFAEVAQTKKHNIKDKADPLQEFVNSTVTTARVSKLIHKLVDEGLLKEDYSIEDMGTILKSLGSSVFDDIIKEESDALFKVVKAKVGRAVPNIVKAVLKEENR